MTPVWSISDGFYRLLFAEERGVEPLLVADRSPDKSPQRIFLVRYVIGEGGGGESERPIFKDELTGYDYEAQLRYPSLRVQLDRLQSSLELSMYGSSEAEMVKTQIENAISKERRSIKVIVSEALVARLIGLYPFAW